MTTSKDQNSRNPKVENSNKLTASHINCHGCKNYYITWDKAAPYGCRFFGFKSKSIPSMVVLASSGEHCNGHQPKN